MNFSRLVSESNLWRQIAKVFWMTFLSFSQKCKALKGANQSECIFLGGGKFIDLAKIKVVFDVTVLHMILFHMWLLMLVPP